MKNKLETDTSFRNKIHTSITQKYFDPEKSEFILVTGHRRENFGEGFINICNALKTIALQRFSINRVYPVHLIPNVSNPVYSLLSEIEKPSSLVWDSLSRPILMTFESHPPYR
jgi:UDP-N-acetylglucosamine 2-epimerase (non-hydrolysing)